MDMLFFKNLKKARSKDEKIRSKSKIKITRQNIYFINIYIINFDLA